MSFAPQNLAELVRIDDCTGRWNGILLQRLATNHHISSANIVELLDGVGRTQEFTSSQTVLDPYDRDRGVGNGPLRNGPVSDLSITWDLVVGRYLNATEDLLKKRHVQGSNPPRIAQFFT